MEYVGNLCSSCPLHEQQKGEIIFRLYIIQLLYNGLTSRGANFYKFNMIGSVKIFHVNMQILTHFRTLKSQLSYHTM